MSNLPIKTGQVLLTQTQLQLFQDLNNSIAEALAVTAAGEITLEHLLDSIDVLEFTNIEDWRASEAQGLAEILASLEMSALYQQGQFDKVRNTVNAVFDNVSEESSLTRDHIDIELTDLYNDVTEQVLRIVEFNAVDINELTVGVNEAISGDLEFINYQMELNKEAIIKDNDLTRTVSTIEFDGLRGFVSNALNTSFDSISSIIGGLGSVIEFLFEEAIDLLKSVTDIDELTLKEGIKTFHKIINSAGQEILSETPPTA